MTGEPSKPSESSTTDEQWKQRLEPEAYRVLREGGTEPPHTGKHLQEHRVGTFGCAACRAKLFRSNAKFESGCGWPSFFAPFEGAITEIKDTSHGMVRTEVRCAACGSHLGHVFPDGPPPTGVRYCINSVCLEFDADHDSTNEHD